MNPKDIISGGIKNVRAKMTAITPKIKEMVQRRWEHCVTCEYRGIVQLPVVKSKHDGCTMCGCPFSEKLKLKSESCPLTNPKWRSEN